MGHELILSILYHLHAMNVADLEISLSSATAYDRFLLLIATSLLNFFPPSDKSFKWLLEDIPCFPDAILSLLEDLCCNDVIDSWGKEIRDIERVTQGLGVLWGLILVRPDIRMRCLDIALKCTIHAQGDIQSKAVRLVALKLHQLNYLADSIEKFAKDMLLCAVEMRHCTAHSYEVRLADQHETVTPQVSETEICGSDSTAAQSTAQCASDISLAEAQQHVSLYFALCIKNPKFLHLIFEVYEKSPKNVKQAIHRHICNVVRTLGSSCTELLDIIYNPPEGCEKLIVLVLQALAQENNPHPNFVAAVKLLHETKIKDATILIPILTSLSKNEVLSVFPQLAALPIDKFQVALAHILQGSASSGPALTPAEVLVAIHDICPDKDALPLKKITEACKACFDQPNVFTQHVLAKALNQMVDRPAIPLIFMRTVIQTIAAFPMLVDVVMEILSKLVSKQIWRFPKLWAGFLKCISQTSPHSFTVLLKLPPQQLENALNKYPKLREPLVAFSGRPSMKASLPKSILNVLSPAAHDNAPSDQCSITYLSS